MMLDIILIIINFSVLQIISQYSFGKKKQCENYFNAFIVSHLEESAVMSAFSNRGTCSTTTSHGPADQPRNQGKVKMEVYHA